ncbi:MAG: putative exported protein of unknown function [Hyphomicrobiales bacterium]|nr:putative exported protein of unknown function [Hyphomicrobiales bacterium]
MNRRLRARTRLLLLATALVAAPGCLLAGEGASLQPAAPAEPVPLWRIPASQLNGMRLRPLFSPARRPAPVIEVKTPAFVPPTAKEEIQPPSATLVGVLLGPDNLSVAILSLPGKRRPQRIHVGETFENWRLASIARDQVVFHTAERTAILEMQPRKIISTTRAANTGIPNQYGD